MSGGGGGTGFFFLRGHTVWAAAEAAKAGERTRNLRRVNMGQSPGRLRWFAWKVDPHLVFGPDVRVDDGEAGKIVGAASLFDDGVGVFQNLIHGHRVHLATVIVTGLNGVLEVAAGGLGGPVVGDDVAGAALLLDPRQVWHGDPDGATVDGKADIGGVGMAGGNGDDGSLPFAMQVFAGPAVGYLEVFIHDWF